MAIEREVVYRLGVQSQPTAGKAFDDLTKKSQQLQGEAKKAGQAVAEAQAKAAGQSSPGGSASGGGLGSSILLQAQAAIAILKQVIEGIRAFGDALKIAQNGAMTEFAKTRAVADRASNTSILGVAARAYLDVKDAFEGTDETIRKVMVSFEKSMTRVAAAAERESRVEEAKRTSSAAESDSYGAERQYDRIASDPMLRDRLGGDYGANYQAILNAETQKQISAEQGMEAWVDRRAYMAEAEKRKKVFEELNRQVVDTNTIDSGDSASRQLQIANNQVEQLARAGKALLEVEKALTRQTSSRVTEARAEYEIKKSQLDLQRRQLSEVEKIADAYGSLNMVEQMEVNRLNKFLADGGSSANVSAWQRDLLSRSGLGQQFLDRRRDETINSSVFRDALAAGGRTDLLDAANRRQEIQASLIVEVSLNEAKLKQAIRDAMRQSGVDVEQIRKEIELNTNLQKETLDRQRVIMNR